MNSKTRVSLISPFLDGDYYGRVFLELLNEAKQHHFSLFTIQSRAAAINPIPFNYPVGTSLLDGWFLMTNPQSLLPLDTELLKKMEDSGKPVVTIGYEENRIDCHSVVIDNRESTKAAVIHLIKNHGHTKIAFVGSNNEHVEISERFYGYLEALSECDIEFNEELVFYNSDALRVGGYQSAEKMLSKKIDFTAVFASTDLNAMGVIEKLQGAGLKIPEDIAVIGFDDLPSAETFNPPLTTVRQSFKDLAKTSFDILNRQLSGDSKKSSLTKITTELKIRSSCGCDYNAILEPTDDVKKQLKKSNQNLDTIIKRYDSFVRRWASATREKTFNFSNMFSEKTNWGCLALWDKSDTEKKDLIITQAFSKTGEPAAPLGLKVPVEQFPPIDWLPNLAEDDFVRVHSVKNERGDWGFVAIIGPVDDLILISAADITQISYTIAASALERDELFEQIQLIAEQLEIVSKTTNDGISDLDIRADRIEWNYRSNDIFKTIGEELPTSSESFFNLIHPEDNKRVRANWNNHLKFGNSFKTECRIQGKNKEELWVYLTADSLHDKYDNVIRVIGSITNISDKKFAEQQIRHLAFHDGLTGLPNRQKARDTLDQYIEEANRHQFKLGVLLIDLNRFKVINDTLGHHAGDQLIKNIAGVLNKAIQPFKNLSQSLHQRALVSRLGGDEFVILMADIEDVNVLYSVGNRINDLFKEPFVIENQEVFASASIGGSIYPDHGINFDELSKCSDMAMYRAKENGNNQVEIYTPELDSKSMERFSMENQLRKALERKEFILNYQPQLLLQTNQIVGVEALLRWQSPVLGTVAPMDFIPLAEELGLFIPIGQWVLKEACQQTKKWMEMGFPPMILSVNISSRQMQQKEFVQMVKSVLDETKFPPQFLSLEITEGTASTNVSENMKMLEQLGDLGVNIAIDDFGTGYSSLAMIKKLPVSTIKIDKSFIQDMHTDFDNAAIVNAITAMAHSLHLTVTAEGVENKDQEDLLRKINVNYVQGFYYSKALTPEKFENYLNSYTSRPLS